MRHSRKIIPALIAVAFFAIHPAYGAESRKATVQEVRGEVLARTGGSDWQAAQAGLVLEEQDEVRTGADSEAVILLDDDKVGKVELREKSYFRVNTLKEDTASGRRVTLLDLAEGKLRVYAKKRKDGSKFEVRTPTAIAGVRGTVFDVSVDEKKK
ncbi:MAG: FecR family protein [Candidatus Omnitrophota bacterium]|jgi:hypothetical protein